MNRSRAPIIVFLLLLAAVVGLVVIVISGSGDEPLAQPSSTLGTTSSDAPGTSSAPSSSDAPQPTYTPEFEESRCRFDEPPGTNPTCGWLTVPEDRTNVDNGREVRIHVAIFKGTGGGDPMVYLDGGPGGETLDTLVFSFESAWAPLLEHGDLIFFDQRGVGWARPSLDCPEELELTYQLLDEDLEAQEYLDRQRAALGECRQRLVDDGVDLTAYDSATNAADVEDLRRALGFERWNLLGISYGTRLAQTVVRDHPEGVRAVILDSSYPIEATLNVETPRNLDRALDTLFAACEADAACAAAYPDLESRTFALADRLDEEPIDLVIRDFLSGRRYNTFLDGAGLLGTFFQALYSETLLSQLPEMVAQLEKGQTNVAQLLLSNSLTQVSFISFGMNLSVQCREEVSFTDPADVAAGIEDYPQLTDVFEISNVSLGAFALCETWDAGASPSLENEAVVSDLPILVLAGGFDPITPPRWGRDVAANYANAYFVEFPTLGHGTSIAGECPVEITLAFLADPASEPDTSCIGSMEPPVFVAEVVDPGSIVLELFEDDYLGFTISGVFPAGWSQIQPGAWARESSGIDQTALVQQATSSFGLTSQLFLDLLEEQLGIEDGLTRDREFSSDGGVWDVYTGTVDGFAIDLALRDADDVISIVFLISDEDERQGLLPAVFEPALREFRAT